MLVLDNLIGSSCTFFLFFFFFCEGSSLIVRDSKEIDTFFFVSLRLSDKFFLSIFQKYNSYV